MDLLKYQEILGENVMLSGRKLKLWCHWTFQQDNEAYLKFHLGLVAEEVLEDSSGHHSPDSNHFEPAEINYE